MSANEEDLNVSPPEAIHLKGSTDAEPNETLKVQESCGANDFDAAGHLPPRAPSGFIFLIRHSFFVSPVRRPLSPIDDGSYI